MHLNYTPEQQALREQVRAYIREMMTPELTAELIETHGGGPLYMEAVRKLGRDGWLGLGYPKSVGGQEAGPIEQFIFFDEAQACGFPVPILTLNTVGPMILHNANEEQRNFFIPKILKGECHFSIGYTEPGSGTDLASIRTTARIEGDEFVIRGQKIWTSLADHADYIWLAARTDPDAAAHAGISMIIVPKNSPGITMSKIHAVGDNNAWAVYYDDVRVPVSNLVGKLHGGWKLLTGQLNHERVALNAVGPMQRLCKETAEYAATVEVRPGEYLIDEPWVQANIARVQTKLDVLELMNVRQAWAIKENRLNPADASAIKVWGSELYVEAARALLEVLAEGGVLRTYSPGAAIAGEIERYYRTSLLLTYGGGTNEIQRDIIAMAGLRFPRARR